MIGLGYIYIMQNRILELSFSWRRASNLACNSGTGQEQPLHVVRICAAARFGGDVFAFADDPTMELLYTLLVALEGSQNCPYCGRCRSDCAAAQLWCMIA